MSAKNPHQRRSSVFAFFVYMYIIVSYISILIPKNFFYIELNNIFGVFCTALHGYHSYPFGLKTLPYSQKVDVTGLQNLFYPKDFCKQTFGIVTISIITLLLNCICTWLHQAKLKTNLKRLIAIVFVVLEIIFFANVFVYVKTPFFLDGVLVTESRSECMCTQPRGHTMSTAQSPYGGMYQMNVNDNVCAKNLPYSLHGQLSCGSIVTPLVESACVRHGGKFHECLHNKHTCPVWSKSHSLSGGRRQFKTVKSADNCKKAPHINHILSMDMNDNKIHSKITDRLSTWEKELKDDPDSKYLLNGVATGFDILEGKNPKFEAEMANYRSVTNPTSRVKAEAHISHELNVGNYKIVQSKPQVISSLGAVPKQDGDIRLIHDLSRPNGGINAFVTDSSCSYNTVDLATNYMSPGCYLSKIDLRSAYRSIPIKRSNQKYTGLSWIFAGDTKPTYFVDSKLPFGARKSCQIFSRVSDSISRMLRKQGVRTVNYLDDMLVISDTKTANWLHFDKAINLLTQLGFEINWKKIEPPTQSIDFLGVHINTVSRTLSLPANKLVEFQKLVSKWTLKCRASKKEIQKFLGKMNWAARVVRGGRTFMRRLIDLTCKLRAPHHRIWLGKEARADILWWKDGLSVFHGSTKFVADMPPPSTHFWSDSCRSGGGAICGNDWFYVNYSVDHPKLVDNHINCLELATVLFSARRWGHLWSGKHIIVKCDNSASVYAINKGTSRAPVFMELLRELFWLSEKYAFRLSASHIKGDFNFVADAISQLHDPFYRRNLCKL